MSQLKSIYVLTFFLTLGQEELGIALLTSLALVHFRKDGHYDLK